MYLTYSEYQEYGGQKTEAEFKLLESVARGRIDELTWRRVQRMAEVPEAVKMAMMYIILYSEKNGPLALINNPLVVSFNTDGYSEGYGSAETQTDLARRALDEAVLSMLNGVDDDYGVPLLHTGVGGDYPMWGWTKEKPEDDQGEG